ncbi:hypothetical protein HPHPH3_0189 [Helicobacter pylori Hp H-3]|nr:hypothetical protein HPHPH3_0189 [Helicobacter pylori Hp H-3]
MHKQVIVSLKSGLLGLGGFSWGLWERIIVKFPYSLKEMRFT